MAEYDRTAIEKLVIDEVTEIARKVTHIDNLAPGRAVEWILGEYKRLSGFEAADFDQSPRKSKAKG